MEAAWLLISLSCTRHCHKSGDTLNNFPSCNSFERIRRTGFSRFLWRRWSQTAETTAPDEGFVKSVICLRNKDCFLWKEQSKSRITYMFVLIMVSPYPEYPEKHRHCTGFILVLTPHITLVRHIKSALCVSHRPRRSLANSDPTEAARHGGGWSRKHEWVTQSRNIFCLFFNLWCGVKTQGTHLWVKCVLLGLSLKI